MEVEKFKEEVIVKMPLRNTLPSLWKKRLRNVHFIHAFILR